MASLFAWSFLSQPLGDLASFSGKTLTEGDFDQLLEKTITHGVADNLELIDAVIETAAPEWPLNQMDRIDLVVLRIAIFELMFCSKVPHKVVINEAIELAKEFGGDLSGKFVNGVLGTVVDQLGIEKKSPKKPTDAAVDTGEN